MTNVQTTNNRNENRDRLFIGVWDVGACLEIRLIRSIRNLNSVARPDLATNILIKNFLLLWT
jgi:hypothetical protein